MPAGSRPWLNKLAVLCAVVMALLVLVVIIVADKSRDEAARAIKAPSDSVAKILRRTQDGVFCVTSTYNNATAEFSKGKVERCEPPSPRKSRANTMMNWQGN